MAISPPGPLGLRYLELLKRSLLGQIYIDNELRIRYLKRCVDAGERYDPIVLRDIQRHFPDDSFAVSYAVELGAPLDGNLDNLGFEHTMIGRKRLDNIQECVGRIMEEEVPGDLIECGVWRGGAAVFMRGLLEAWGVHDRKVWVADSFQGLPPPSAAPDLALGLDFSANKFPALAVDLDTVIGTFGAYDLLDDQVKFLKGWFKDTLAGAAIERLALLRLDGDLYESTRDALQALYDKLVPGGYVIVDDFFLESCQKAVHEFRAARAIETPMVTIDWTGVYWRKEPP